ncbi:CPBP family intramembrane glutamic endopeptidase [Actinoallomurus iriomotensis]|uniref:CPBP family intramembrane metalloprotease n=1 Tax=Actinoallomurus iriomotensis TaxID=478107 RepID=A0A9W6RQE9_9ACTN|nr:CPBP family intramembrane glutamic endopeptidase [Actinoallomurus iriomotensis]GLY79954.1 CPBP family intramembrane metalloprotease [Actinoallomurus iriomotensis]
MEKRTGVLAYLLISFGLSWGYLFTARLWLGLSLVNPLVQLPMGFAPAVAAVVVRRWVTGEGFRDAGLAVRLRRGWSSYLLAWVGPLPLVAAAVTVAALLGLWKPDLTPLGASGLPEWATPLLLMVAVVPLTPVYWGEEFGWTGYLRPRLFAGRPAASVAATGLIWAVWHYPLAFLGYIQFGDVVLGLAVWTMSFMFQEVVLAWLWARSGSVWAPSLAHAGNNMVLSLLTGELLSKLGATATTLLMALPIGAVAAWILLTGRLGTGRRAAPRPAGYAYR